MKRKKKMIIWTIGLLGSIGLIFGLNYLYRTYRYKQIVADIVIEPVDLAQISDGVYSGEFDALLVGSKTKVTVKDNQIAAVDLIEHKTELGEKAEKIVDDVVKQQSLEVDVVSGATNSSKVILKSIENALNSAVDK
ncbi:FMN-binding protein [Enterococcus sp. BWM-S5]|uniref:FMN-binding protein n=1 Tax=Enterococcus larvae TaxID=2794352 RepID=A0ABS4CGH7_9ENTE|nr:FMN-binding protein [Enterococcus larvae]MBP1045721.1 FMN-binding protein [Enterococcus larvae]